MPRQFNRENVVFSTNVAETFDCQPMFWNFNLFLGTMCKNYADINHMPQCKSANNATSRREHRKSVTLG